MEEEINRLRFENKIWILFAFLCLLNIRGDDDDINYIKTNNNKYKNESNNIFKFTLICTLFIYLYFFRRNVRFYNKANSKQKELYSIKVYGSLLLIVGVILLIYFQVNQDSFEGGSCFIIIYSLILFLMFL